jgi:hypothetical protein
MANAAEKQPHDVHAIAAEAADLEAQTEQFFDHALITDFQETPLTTLDDVLEERREAAERRERVQSRAKEVRGRASIRRPDLWLPSQCLLAAGWPTAHPEADASPPQLLDEEMSKRKHERELKDLEEAITATQQPAPAVTGAASSAGKREAQRRSAAAAPAADAPTAAEAESAVASATSSLPFKLESAGTRANRDANPYVLNLTEFVSEGEATRQARELHAENELLRKCLGDAKRPGAFESYLRSSRHTAL